MVGAREPVKTPGIYLLIYDAYVENETMLGYGIDNLDQQQYLEELGFKIYPDTYSIMAYHIRFDEPCPQRLNKLLWR